MKEEKAVWGIHDGAGGEARDMTLRVIQWNIKRSRSPAIEVFLRQRVGQGPAILCLEEVTRSAYDRLTEFFPLAPSCFSLDMRMPGHHEGGERAIGVAVLAFVLPIVTLELIDRAPFPERTLSVLLGGPFGPMRVVAFHSLTGSGYLKAKASNFASIADYLEQHRAELDFLCFDANEPNKDSMDVDKIEFSSRSDRGRVKKVSLIMGNHKVHRLTDSYVAYLKSKGEFVEGNPLALSYKKKLADRRYDYIMHSPAKWRVTNCDYPYKDSVAAHSDHSAVIADFEPV